MRQSVRLSGLVAIAILMSVANSFAQDYPNRPIRLIVTFPAGGSADIMARAVAPKAGEILGQTITIENRPGAGGNIGMDAVAKSAPDGYTLGLGAAGALAVNPSLYPNMPYDSRKDFAPISLLARLPFIFVANPGAPENSVQDLVRAAKQKPGAISIGHGGNGTAMHLSAALLTYMTDTKLTYVPYKGTAPATSDTMAGHIPFAVSDLPPSIALIKAGKLKVLAITSKDRSRFLPDVPTVAEAGVPGYESIGWFGFVAPAGTPPAIIQKLNDAFVRAMKDPSLRPGFEAAGADPSPTTPEEFRAFIDSELEKWAKVIKATGIKQQ